MYSIIVIASAFDYIDAPVERVTGLDVPMPYSKPLED
jgi:pyruvate dehydrogenase E1 component beta subunit